MRFDTGSHLWGREIAKKEADHARLVGDGFNKKKYNTHEAHLEQPQDQ